MAYIIDEENGKFKVTETGYKPLLLGTYDTKEEAEKSVRQWKARDAMAADMAEFLDEVVQKYEGILGDEVRQILTETDWR